ncbi:hypothetical protein RvY_09677-3 [Ramazzottius varieornatus]|uniref:Uncharacterized protein n=1 Tax=Ramazzottius varieornatus TaxID=947166 RepID=A0A1D1VA72_RAMVA|nr:hypothetical protein RvY_09677-3 [Ramazzottius varieornatus]
MKHFPKIRTTRNLLCLKHQSVLATFVVFLLEAYRCDSKLHWKNMPYSQTGSLHAPSTATNLPAELRNAPSRNQTESVTTAISGSGNDLNKSATILVRKPVIKIGELLHGQAPEPRARKPPPGSMTQFMIENDLLPDVHGQLRPVAHDQCIVTDLPATFPFGYRPRRDRSGRRRSLESDDDISSSASELSRMFPFWWQHTETRKSKPTVSRIRSHCLYRSTEPEIDLCRSSEMQRYRTLDGTCNNLVYTKWGAVGNRYSRLTMPRYDDGIGRPRLKAAVDSYDDQPAALPNARKISRTMSQSLPIPHRVGNLFLPYFGQLVAHDLAFTPTYRLHGQDVDCCVHNAFCNQPECFQFSISTDDPLYSHYNLTCHQFARSEYLMHKSCTSGKILYQTLDDDSAVALLN